MAAAIVSHGLRARCWYALAERTMSPKELADELRAPLSDVSYHVRVLRDLGVIELVRTEPVRGAVAHYYRSVERPSISTEEIGEITPEDSIANATRIVQSSFADIGHSLDTGTYTKRDAHAAIRYPMDLDEQGWAKAAELFESLLENLYEVQAESDERRDPETPSIKATALAFFFESPRRSSGDRDVARDVADPS
ncbi:MAG: winged helix-turn-helix domain-containing protein [Solirubrobacterales bacterium]